MFKQETPQGVDWNSSTAFDSPDYGKTGGILGREMPRIEDIQKFVSRHPRIRTAAEVAAVLLITGTTLVHMIGGGGIPVVRAEEGPKSTSAPVATLAQKETTEWLNGIINNPSAFTYQGQPNMWEGDNARWGFDFNDSDRLVGTFDQFVAGTYQISDQLYQGYYPETAQGNGIFVAAAGIIVKPEANRAILLSATSDNVSGVMHPAGVEIWDLRDTHNLSLRTYVPRTGLPTASDGGPYNSFSDGIDTQGRYYIEAGAVRSLNPSEKDGKYRHYFNAAYQPVGNWVYMPQYKVYLPIVIRNAQQ